MRQQLTRYVLSFVLSIAVPWVVPAQQADPGAFKTIAFPDAVTTGGPGTRLGINPEGQIVGRYKSVDISFHGFVLTEGEFTTITFPGSGRTEANGHQCARRRGGSLHR